MSDFVASVIVPAPLAPWRPPLARALHRNRSKPYSRYFQLATVQPQGRPANRTVVFRGFYPHSNGLMLVTDQRSQKVSELTAHPWAEGCWYFTQTREQFRFSGQVTLVTMESPDASLGQVRAQTWQALSEAGRQSFYWPPPGTARSSDPNAFIPSPETALEPPPSFCLGILIPDQVDHLELRGDPQNRTRYDEVAPGQWQTTAFNP